MGLEAMAATLSSVALIARRRRDATDMQPAWSRSAAALLLVGPWRARWVDTDSLERWCHAASTELVPRAGHECFVQGLVS